LRKKLTGQPHRHIVDIEKYIQTIYVSYVPMCLKIFTQLHAEIRQPHRHIANIEKYLQPFYVSNVTIWLNIFSQQDLKFIKPHRHIEDIEKYIQRSMLPMFLCG
jgi:hypothetical protein